MPSAMSPNQKALNLNKDIDELNGEPRGKVQYQRPRLTTHSTGRAISLSFIARLARFGGSCAPVNSSVRRLRVMHLSGK